jgi:hypothetical protein
MTPAFSWQSVVTPEARAKLLSGPYTSPAMASPHAVAIAADGSVWAQWAAGCQWVATPDAEKLAANMLLAEVERLRAMVPPPGASQVIRLHQAWEGTTSCYHCGAPMPWADMEVCPRKAPKPMGWTKWGDTDRADKGLFLLWVRSDGWKLKVNGQDVDGGPETGDAGKSKAVAAWQRACGAP